MSGLASRALPSKSRLGAPVVVPAFTQAEPLLPVGRCRREQRIGAELPLADVPLRAFTAAAEVSGVTLASR
jgi:hypothetical protein